MLVSAWLTLFTHSELSFFFPSSLMKSWDYFVFFCMQPQKKENHDSWSSFHLRMALVSTKIYKADSFFSLWWLRWGVL